MQPPAVAVEKAPWWARLKGWVLSLRRAKPLLLATSVLLGLACLWVPPPYQQTCHVVAKLVDVLVKVLAAGGAS